MSPPIHPELLEIVRCPKCKGKVEVRDKTASQGPGLACGACQLLFPIVDEIPNFLIDEAQPLRGEGG